MTINGTNVASDSLEPDILTTLAAEVDRQRVLDLGGEPLAGSGFEHERSDTEFEQEGDSHA